MTCDCDSKKPKYANPAPQFKEEYITSDPVERRVGKINFGQDVDYRSETVTGPGFPIEKEYEYTKPKIVDGGYIRLKILTRYSMGDNLLGFTEPGKGYIAIRGDIKGDLFTEVELHETTHIRHPDASEQSVRDMVRRAMPKAKG